MSRIVLAAVLCLVAAVSAGCGQMSIARHNEIVDAQREYVRQLEARNQGLEASNASLLRQDDEDKLARTTDELYAGIAKQLEGALKDLCDSDGDGMTHNGKGVWTAGTDLLFESGSWTISTKGKEVLKKWAEAHRTANLRFRVVGHTDKAPIARASTKDKLETDTNMELSVRRAVAVMGLLKEFGIAEKSFVECVGRGSSQPCDSTSMKKNRRVEISVISGSTSVPTSAPKNEKKTK